MIIALIKIHFISCPKVTNIKYINKTIVRLCFCGVMVKALSGIYKQT